MNDPENFENPDQFLPERHLDENGNFLPNAKVCSFSVGKRNCIGQHLAKMEYFWFTAKILLSFQLSLVEGE